MIVRIVLPTLNPYNRGMSRPHGFKQTEETKEKIRQGNLGKLVSEETRAKIRGSSNSQWIGDRVGYQALHGWVRRNLVKPEFCEDCGVKPPYDLANKGVYNRNFDNWEYLCRSCHMIKDGRMAGIHSKEVYEKVSKSLKGHPKFYKGDKLTKEV